MPVRILISNVFISMLFIFSWWLSRYRIRPVYIALPIGIGIIINLVNAGFLAGGVNAPVFIMVPMLPVMGFCFGGRPLALIASFVSVGLVIGFVVAEKFNLTSPVLDPTTITMQRASIMLSIVFASYIIGHTYETSRGYAEQRIVEVSHLASLGTMAGGLAHEINNPLAIVMGSANHLEKMATKGSLDVAALLSASQRIDASSKRIAKIVSTLVMYARNDAATPLEPIGLRSVVQNVMDLLDHQFKNTSIELRVSEIADNTVVMARVVQATEALLNLVNNAIDAVKGNVNAWIAVDCVVHPTHIDLRVTDSGPGIGPQLQKKIFTPFFTTKEVGQGTGMGLSLAASLMNQQNGSLTLDTESRNTRFVLCFVRSFALPVSQA